MTWFAFQGLNGGKAIDLAGVQEKIAASWSFHGYATEAQAEARPNTVNVLQRPEADALIADYKAAVAGQEQPGGKNANILNPANAAAGAAEAAASTVPNAFKLVFGNTTGLLTRVLKVVIGGILLVAGILKLTSTDKTLEQVLPLIGGPAGKVLRA